jgi:hypothetical protein
VRGAPNTLGTSDVFGLYGLARKSRWRRYSCCGKAVQVRGAAAISRATRRSRNDSVPAVRVWFGGPNRGRRETCGAMLRPRGGVGHRARLPRRPVIGAADPSCGGRRRPQGPGRGGERTCGTDTVVLPAPRSLRRILPEAQPQLVERFPPVVAAPALTPPAPGAQAARRSILRRPPTPRV